jgi:hypothetical protein
MHDPGDRVIIAQLLDNINEEEVTVHERPMLSAVVVTKEDSIPGQGFFKCAKNVGRYTIGPELVFYCEEVQRGFSAKSVHEFCGISNEYICYRRRNA